MSAERREEGSHFPLIGFNSKMGLFSESDLSADITTASKDRITRDMRPESLCAAATRCIRFDGVDLVDLLTQNSDPSFSKVRNSLSSKELRFC